MRYYPIICTLMLLCSAFYAHGQQVNPFELRTTADSSSIIKDSSSNFTSTNSSIIVIEDSLQKPSILPEAENQAESLTPVVEEEIEQFPAEAVRPEEAPRTETAISTNPFELIATESFVEEEIIVSEGLSPKDSTENTLNEVIDTSAEQSVDSLANNLSSIPETIKEEVVTIPLKGKNLLVFWASLICGLLIAISLNAKSNILSEIWKSFRNLNFMKLLQKEQNNGWSTPYSILFAVYLINVSIFIRFLAISYEIPLFGYSLWKIALFMVALSAIRHLSLYVLSYMRKRLTEPLNYNFIIISINIITGLILLPINLFIAFSSEPISSAAISAGLFILSLSLVTRWFRALINSLRIVIGDSFHFLLYLCSCEIVPIIIMMGYVRNLIN